jgi:hypothetical protein
MESRKSLRGTTPTLPHKGEGVLSGSSDGPARGVRPDCVPATLPSWQLGRRAVAYGAKSPNPFGNRENAEYHCKTSGFGGQFARLPTWPHAPQNFPSGDAGVAKHEFLSVASFR